MNQKPKYRIRAVCYGCAVFMMFVKILPMGKIFLLRETIVILRTKIMDENTVSRTMARITHEVLERNQGVENLCVLGIRRRGVPLARMLCDNIQRFEGVCVPLGELDITARRDDMSEAEKKSRSDRSVIPVDLHDKTVIIVDDVLFTGRTARAAIETVFGYGRPKTLQFVVLVDRGHRELPIRPDYVGKNVPTSRNETVAVRLSQIDGETAVYIGDKENDTEQKGGA